MQDFEQALHRLIQTALAEDIGDGDHSTRSCIPPAQQGRAVLKIKQAGILAGLQVAAAIFRYLEPDCQFEPVKKDGEPMLAGEYAFEVSARVHTLLACERLVLNCMQRMSGIATLTRQYTDLLKGYKTRLLDTRKTTPNFRLLEKEAVRIGGGVNHRFGLYDMIMLKDNHIDFCGGITPAVEAACAYVDKMPQPIPIEVETRSLADVAELCRIGKGRVLRVMLDNFTPELISEALQLIQGDFETEASGGINLENIGRYAETGVDYISVGGLIHQAQSLDL
ncbi:MAG TPA: carboxylating nicotinate-nucleotide diphosphorylase, partial [Sediminibacterium sp.]|nr:carboxylating nicotinate-nucleotide diphosphorylase [Sediminibacterium sp.]